MTVSGTITLDDRALETIQTLLREQGLDPDSGGLRLAVERGGCAGLSYTFALSAEPESDDVVCECDGVRVFVDSASEPYLAGAELSIESTAHGTGFTIDNPNATEECGCGLSFR